MSKQVDVGELKVLLSRACGRQTAAYEDYQKAIEAFSYAMTRAADSVCMAAGLTLAGPADAEAMGFFVGLQSAKPTPEQLKLFEDIDDEGELDD
jgi:hypothetical protein